MKPSRAPVDFERTLEEHRRELTAYCYRMLGAASEAEDAVALLRDDVVFVFPDRFGDYGLPPRLEADG